VVCPVVLFITLNDENPNWSASVGYTVTFSEPVTGVDVIDFSLTTADLTGVSVTNVSGSGDIYIVTVDTGSGAGTLRLDVSDDDSIINRLGNPLGGVGAGNGDFSWGEEYGVRLYMVYLPLVFRNGP